MLGISDKQQRGEGRSARRLYVPQLDSHSAKVCRVFEDMRPFTTPHSPLGLLEFSKTQTLLKQMKSQDVEGY